MSQIDKIRDGLADLGSIVQTIANTETPATPAATVNSISGNAVHGGKITLFRSTGITDQATRNSLLVENDMITVGNADIDNIVGDITVEGNVTVGGELHAKTMHVEELLSTAKHTTSLEFHPSNGSLDRVGLQWRQEGQATKQIVWNQDRFFITNDVDLHRNATLQIDNIPVLSADSLGVTIKHSELEHVGTLVNLRTTGDLNVDEFVTWDSGTMRFAIGAEAPNAQFSVASNEAEFIVDPDFDHVRIGAYTTSKLSIITDNKERITIKDHGHVEVKGKLGINVAYPSEDTDLEVNGAIRMQSRRFGVAEAIPATGNFNKGDILYNTNPTAGGKLGWVCIEGGTPGTWKAFGGIDE